MKLPSTNSSNITGLTGIALMTIHLTGFITGWWWPVIYVFLILSGIGQDFQKRNF